MLSDCFKLVFLLLMFVFMFSCASSKELKRDVLSYSGDGEIAYLEAPFLGGDGVEILMDKIDLSGSLDVSYDLKGIPPHEDFKDGYMMYLLVADPSKEGFFPEDGTLTLIVYQNDNVLKSITSSFGEMHLTRQKGMPARYHRELYGPTSQDSFLVPVPESKRESLYRIEVKIHAPEMVERVPIQIYLRIGGYR